MSKAFSEEGIAKRIQPRISGMSEPFNAAYNTRTCVICGCTETNPCFDGEQVCFWVTMNSDTNGGLCSECIGF